MRKELLSGKIVEAKGDGVIVLKTANGTRVSVINWDPAIPFEDNVTVQGEYIVHPLLGTCFRCIHMQQVAVMEMLEALHNELLNRVGDDICEDPHLDKLLEEYEELTTKLKKQWNW